MDIWFNANAAWDVERLGSSAYPLRVQLLLMYTMGAAARGSIAFTDSCHHAEELSSWFLASVWLLKMEDFCVCVFKHKQGAFQINFKN